LAELIDRPKEAVSNIERGVSLPSLDTIQTICDVTKVSMTSIIEESSEYGGTADLCTTLNELFPQLDLSNKGVAVALTEIIRK